MPATFTISSGSERVEVYPEKERTSSGGSASVHSPASSGGHSFSSDSWAEVDAPYEEDGIEPSDSASRSRDPSRRRHTTEARPAPTRRHSRRVVVEREELPQRQSSHRQQSSRHRRAESRRTPSDESGSVASYDDYPYSHHGGAPMPPRAYPPPSGYRHVPAQTHGGFPPSMAPSMPYPDPYGQALVHMPHDPFAYQQANPFSQPGNPFSPMSSGGGSSYFTVDPHAPPPPVSHHPRPAAPPRPHSIYGSELMSHYPHSGVHYPGYAMPPGYPPMSWPYPPPSHTSTPAPKEEKRDTSELESLKALIQKHEEARLAAEKERLARAEADAAAAAKKKADEEAEKRKKDEIASASKHATDEAEKKAAEAATKAKDEADKKLAEAKKAHEEAEKKAKELEEEAAKNKPTPDSLKAPIRFKDAVDRKYCFPWQICKTWKGMEGLIKQAFLHIDVIGDHVHKGHYDLTGPDGEIILPQVWDTVVKPDWEVTMHLWPLPDDEDKKKKKREERHAAELAALTDPFAGIDFNALPGVDGHRRKKDKGKDGKKKKLIDPILDVPPPPSADIMPPPPPGFPGGLADPLGLAGVLPPGITHIEDKRRSKSKSKSSKDLPPLTRWMVGGGQPSKKEDEKHDLVRHRSHHGTEQTMCVVM